jgi:hypothetical protein
VEESRAYCVRRQSARNGRSTAAPRSPTIEALIGRSPRLGRHVKTRRILNILVTVVALCLGLYRLRMIGPWQPITIAGAALMIFFAAVGVAIAIVLGQPNATTSVQPEVNAKNRSLGLALLGSIVIFLPLLAGWLASTVLTGQHWERAEQKWATTEGVVKSWAIRSSVDERSGRVTWSAYWTYSFTVNDQLFSGTSIEIPSGYAVHWYGSSAAAHADALSRPIGSVVSVYYDPEHPQKSVLDRRTSSSADWVVGGLCLLLLSAATPLCWIIFRIARMTRAQIPFSADLE